MMKLKRCPLIAIAGLPLIALAQVPDVIYEFDDAGSDLVVEATGSGMDFKVGGASIMSNEHAKFGTGSLKIEPLNDAKPLGRGWYLFQDRGAFVSLNDSIKQMTIVCWIRPIDTTKSLVFFRRHERDPVSTITFAWINEELALSVNTDGISSKVTSEADVYLSNGKWTHVAVTYDKGEVAFYVDGQLAGNATLPDHSEIPAPMSKAAFAGLLDAPRGTFMDDFAFFGNRALSQTDIQAICAEGLKAFIQ